MDMFSLYSMFESIWGSIKDNKYEDNQAILCTLIDAIAGQDGKKGYEMIESILPILKDVGDSLGAAI